MSAVPFPALASPLRFALLALALAAGAARADQPERLRLPSQPALLKFEATARPPNPDYASAVIAPSRANATLAREFVDLVFRLERGAARRRLPKWPQPIGVDLDPQLEPGFGAFLDAFLGDVRARGGVAIRPSRELAAPAARITVRLAPTFAMMRRLGSSFCVAAPGDITWEAYEARLEGDQAGAPDWARLVRPTSATVFVPDRARPFQIRACLMEETLQALGPAGDYFALGDSIFNDDGARQQPTDYDFLMLRVLYDNRLRAGMSEARARAAARTVLDDLRPEGRGSGGGESAATKRDAVWLKLIRAARAQHHPKFAEDFYARAAERAAGFDATDQRRLFTEFERAGNLGRYAPLEALRLLDALELRLRRAPGADGLWVALAAQRRAEVLLSLGRFQEAGAAAERARPVFLAQGREDALAETLLTRRAAERGLRQIHTDQPLPPPDAAWRDYAFGLAAALPRPAEARRPPSMMALSLALGLTAAPLLVFLRLVAWVF